MDAAADGGRVFPPERGSSRAPGASGGKQLTSTEVGRFAPVDRVLYKMREKSRRATLERPLKALDRAVGMAHKTVRTAASPPPPRLPLPPQAPIRLPA